MTYNIHKGIGGVDRRYELNRVIEVLRSCEPDIAFLQEVDEGAPRSLGGVKLEMGVDLSLESGEEGLPCRLGVGPAGRVQRQRANPRRS